MRELCKLIKHATLSQNKDWAERSLLSNNTGVIEVRLDLLFLMYCWIYSHVLVGGAINLEV